MSDDQTPKIIVDDDWKSQARAEKEKLKASEPAKPDSEQGGDLPEKIGFEHLLEVLATQALMYLGAYPDPQSGRAMLAPDLAKLHIDLLGVVEEKTRGNLTEDESRKIKGILHELRMQFVEISKAIAKAVQEGKISPADLQGGGPIGGTSAPSPGV